MLLLGRRLVQAVPRFPRDPGSEIMQQDHDLLLVEARLGRIAHDQGRGEKPLLLEANVGMHPVGAGPGQGEVVIVG